METYPLHFKKLDRLVSEGVINGYECLEMKGDYGMSPYQTLTITLTNGEKIEISSRGGCEAESWLAIE